ncbi:C-GCAxxG-C-C family (seleno)protein [Dethiobacter alkaliphilus]|uniref:C-GCAxxG-C-C family (seleno)protein n=1 Tax=Dethiobacter alkaliphilus TaxID=427926 RepID=UPI002225B923|nr:C-GCAxxG-C-C family (seleno)protein [Dethiobacter alkaliphilus]MCW3488506.1 C-GCAxxG-C-C family protein [Dethiobacter alkaliphilus]
MRNEVSVNKVRQDAEDMFRRGDFYCSESIIKSVKDNFAIDMPDEIIAMASGFPVGIGKSKCVCGAVSGGVMALGYFFGRTTGGDPKVQKTLVLANELQQSFKDNHKHLCCRILTKGMDMAAGGHKDQCVSFTGEIAEKVAAIVVREQGLVNLDEQ